MSSWSAVKVVLASERLGRGSPRSFLARKALGSCFATPSISCWTASTRAIAGTSRTKREAQSGSSITRPVYLCSAKSSQRAFSSS